MHPVWTKLFDAATIAERVQGAAARMRSDFGDEEVVLVGLLQGGLFFLSDLARALGGAVRLATLTAQSYRGLQSSGRVELSGLGTVNIRDRHVVVVDDIYDSGRTLYAVGEALRGLAPRSLAFACLLVKEAERVNPVEVKYGLFPIADRFVVGYGLDLDGLGRNLDAVWALEPGVSEQVAREQLLAQLLGRGK